RQYGKESVTTIRENPYLLERDVQGVGFRTADALAVRLGLPRDALPRYMTGMKHVLSEAANADGHCYLERDDLLTRAAALLSATPCVPPIAPRSVSSPAALASARPPRSARCSTPSTSAGWSMRSPRRRAARPSVCPRRRGGPLARCIGCWSFCRAPTISPTTS